MDKLERLLNLTLALLETARPLTSHDIQDRVPGYPDSEVAFRRAFERDKESLREMGIKVTLTEISHTDPPSDGYRIRPEDYYLRDPGFEPDEIAALHFAASTVRLETVHGVEGLWKLGGVASGVDSRGSGEHDRGGVTSGATTLAELPSDPNLGPLFGAVAERAMVTFTYNAVTRHLDPYRLDYQRGRWYLTGFDHDRGEERNFRLDRIQGDVAAGSADAFKRPPTAIPGGAARPWQFGEGDPIDAYVSVDSTQAPWVRQHLGAEMVQEERDDGSVVFKVSVTSWPAFRSFVLTFLDHAEILAPAELRTAMIDWLGEVAGGRLGRDASSDDGQAPQRSTPIAGVES